MPSLRLVKQAREVHREVAAHCEEVRRDDHAAGTGVCELVDSLAQCRLRKLQERRSIERQSGPSRSLQCDGSDSLVCGLDARAMCEHHQRDVCHALQAILSILMDALIIAVYFIAVFGVGFYHSRNKDNTTEYFLAGKHIGWFALGATLFSTNIGSEHVIGLAGSGASSGLAVGTYEWSASFCLLLLGWLFIPQYLRSGVFTMPEFLERRFSPGARWYLTTVSLLAYILTKISVALFAAGILAREIFGWDYMTTALLLVVATGIYTITGGLAAVIWTDFLQAFIMIGGSLFLTVIGLSEAGGFAGLREALPDDFFHIVKEIDHPEYPWLGTTLGTMILGTWYWCTDQVIVQKTLSARNLTHARGGTIMASALKITPVFILVLPGLIAHALWPGEATGDTAFPLMVQRLLPPGLSGLMVAALLAALMSSLSSVLNSCSTLITMDIYKKLRPDASEKRLVFVGRLITGMVVLVGILWIPMIRYLSGEVYQYMQSVQAYIGAPITATFLMGILWKGGTSRAALATLICGGLAGAGRFALDILSKAYGMDLGPLDGLVQIPFLNYSCGVFAGCLLLFWIVSKLGERPMAAKIAGLTVRWDSTGTSPEAHRLLVGFSSLVALTVLSLWFYFR